MRFLQLFQGFAVLAVSKTATTAYIISDAGPKAPSPQGTWTAPEYNMSDYAQPNIMVNYNVYVPKPNDIITVVYNCYWMKAICKNVMQHTGQTQHPIKMNLHLDAYRPKGSTTRQLKSRLDLRRQNACGQGKTWQKKAHPTNPGPRPGKRCPEADQPQEFAMEGSRQWYKFTLAQQGTSLVNGAFIFWPVNGSQMYKPPTVAVPAGSVVTLPENEYWQAALTCDEFPPASTIEGGIGASTYCAPQLLGESQCTTPEGQTPSFLDTTTTEQNWQSRAHRTVTDYYQKIAKKARKAGKTPQVLQRDYTVFRYLFETENNSTSGDAAYVKINGQKYRCAGGGPVPTAPKLCPKSLPVP